MGKQGSTYTFKWLTERLTPLALTHRQEAQISTNLAQAETDNPSMSFFKRLVGIYVHPLKTFEDVALNPDFVLPILTVVQVNLLVVWAAISRFGIDRLTELKLTRGAPGVYFPDHSAISSFATVFDLHFRAILVPAMLVVCIVAATAGIELRVFHRKPTFKVPIALAAYASLVYVLGGFLGLGVVFLGDPERYNPLLPSPTNVGFFLDPLKYPRQVIDVAGLADILSVWFLILYGTAIMLVKGWKVPKKWWAYLLAAIFLVFCLSAGGYLFWSRYLSI